MKRILCTLKRIKTNIVIYIIINLNSYSNKYLLVCSYTLNLSQSKRIKCFPNQYSLLKTIMNYIKFLTNRLFFNR